MDQKPQQPRRKNRSTPSLRSRALGMLARRDCSRLELIRRLRPYAQDGDDIPALLDDFERRGWLSERRLAEQLTVARRGRFGMRRIAQELRQKGIADELIEAALPALNETELETARAIRQRKFGALPRNAAERARQVRFLQGRGFALEIALRAIGGHGEDEASI